MDIMNESWRNKNEKQAEKVNGREEKKGKIKSSNIETLRVLTKTMKIAPKNFSLNTIV